MRRKFNMDEKEHKEKHKLLHKYLDELVADFVQNTNKIPSETSVMELMEWSHKQTLNKNLQER